MKDSERREALRQEEEDDLGAAEPGHDLAEGLHERAPSDLHLPAGLHNLHLLCSEVPACKEKGCKQSIPAHARVCYQCWCMQGSIRGRPCSLVVHAKHPITFVTTQNEVPENV